MKIKRRDHTVPSLNLASLPDLIFTVLFFFMIVTHMRNVTPRVQYETPEGTEIAKLPSNQPHLYIYVGSESPLRIQVNNLLVEPERLASAIESEKMSLPVADRQRLTALVKADRHVPMAAIMQIKQALREANIPRITYSATRKSTPKSQISK